VLNNNGEERAAAVDFIKRFGMYGAPVVLTKQND
jgi:hypothetical protein